MSRKLHESGIFAVVFVRSSVDSDLAGLPKHFDVRRENLQLGSSNDSSADGIQIDFELKLANSLHVYLNAQEDVVCVVCGCQNGRDISKICLLNTALYNTSSLF